MEFGTLCSQLKRQKKKINNNKQNFERIMK